MVEDSNVTQVTEDIFARKESNTFHFFHKNATEMGDVILIPDPKIRSLILTVKLKSYFWSIQQLQKLLFVYIYSTMKAQFFEIYIDSYPLSHQDFDEIVQVFNLEYPNSFQWSCEVFGEKELSKITISIKTPRVTHFVQQGYLRNFSSNRRHWEQSGKKKEARIFCYNKIDRKIEVGGNRFGQRIEKVAYIERFYSLEMEHLLARTLEKAITPIFQLLREKREVSCLTKKSKAAIVQWIVLQRIRTIEARLTAKELIEKGITALTEDHLVKHLGKSYKDKIKVTFDDNNLRLEQENIINKLVFKPNSVLAHLFFDLLWKIIHPKREYFYYTSDNPVVLFNQFHEEIVRRMGDSYEDQKKQAIREIIKSEGGSGFLYTSTGDQNGRAFLMDGLEIYLPISPHSCLVLMDDNYGKQVLSTGEINREIILQSTKHIFSHINNFEFVEKVLEKYSKHINKNGNRASAVAETFPEEK